MQLYMLAPLMTPSKGVWRRARSRAGGSGMSDSPALSGMMLAARCSHGGPPKERRTAAAVTAKERGRRRRGGHLPGGNRGGGHPLQQDPRHPPPGRCRSICPPRRFLPRCVRARGPGLIRRGDGVHERHRGQAGRGHVLQRMVRAVPDRLRHDGGQKRRGAAGPDGPGGKRQRRRDRRREVRRLPERLRRGRPRLPPPGHLELRPRDERHLVLLGLPAHLSGGVRGRLAAHRHPVPRAGSAERDLAVDGQHRQRHPAWQDPSARPRGGPAART